MSTEQRKAALLRLGYFGESSYISIGEPYDTKRAERKPDNDDAPPNFKLSTNAIKGKFSMLNGLFDPQGGVGTGVGCMYTTLAKESLKAEKAKRSKQVSEEPFRPSNPGKKSGGNLGTHYGAVNYLGNKTSPAYPIGARIEYIPQGSVEPIKKGMVTHETANIMTNPIKKGGFGVPNTTIGCPMAGAERRNWLASSQYFYAADPYDGARQKAKDDKKKAPKNVSENPFRCSSYTIKGGPGKWGGKKAGELKNFGGQINAYPEYIEDPVFAQKKRRQISDEEANKAPFKPSNPAKAGGPGKWATLGRKDHGKGVQGGLLHSFPAYVEDGYENKRLLAQAEKKKIDEQQAKYQRAPFSSTVPANPRSTRTTSIFKMNIRI